MATDPICGMAVAEGPEALSLLRENRAFFFCSEACREEFAEPELQLARLRTDLLVAWPASAVVLLLTYAAPNLLGGFAVLPLAALVQFLPGRRFYRGTFDAIHSRIWNMDVLIAVGTTLAFGYSTASLLLPGRLSATTYFDASTFIITLILTGYYLEHLTREQARGTLRSLQELLPTTVLRVRGGEQAPIPLDEVRPGDTYRVLPGARIPTDGVVREGTSLLDEAVLSGESVPVVKRPGSPVLSGAINGRGVLLVEATRVGTDTFLAQISHLVSEAETSRVPLQRLADRIASRFVPLVLVIAFVASVAWYLGGAGITIGLLVFVSIAVTACPCAFGIATPAALMVGTSKAAAEGVLFKGRDSLYQASRVDTVLLDKTGTLTRGVPVLSDLVPAPGVDPARLLAIAAGLEGGSEHPFAQAVSDAAQRRGIAPLRFDRIEALPGSGIQGQAEGAIWSIRGGSLHENDSFSRGGLHEPARRLDVEGKSWSVVSQGDWDLGLLGFSDELDPSAREFTASLLRKGIAVSLVTGDREGAANRIATSLGISDVHANMTPGAKLRLIRELQRRGRRVAYVGDGINDAPALTAAELGIAMGAGTDVAKESGGAILVRSDLRGVNVALNAGRRTVRKVRENLGWAIGYNAVLLPIAAGALVPVFGLDVFRFLPVTGALAMGLSSTTVLLSSLSLRWHSFAD